MIVLNTTTDKVIVALDGAVTTNELSCMSSFRDITTSTYAPGRVVALTTGATPVDLVGSPADSTQRVVDYLSVYNRDTISQVVTISFDDNATPYTLFSTSLSAGEKIEYIDGQGFRVIANSGAIKNSINQGNNTMGNTLTAVVLGSDVVNNNATLNTIEDVTGLSFPVTNGKTYYFKFVIPYTAAATTTGSRWSINGPTSTFSMTSEYSLTATTTTRNANIQTYNTPAGSNATSASTANNMAVMQGYLRATDDGDVIARFASEVANSAITAKAGAVVYYQELL